MTLHAPYDPTNIFARILRGDAPCVKVWEDADVLSFMDVFPQSEGHTLLISKTSQARNLLDSDAHTLTALTLAAQAMARAVTKALNPDGVQIMQFSGAAAGQTVFHLHFHVIPRWSDRPADGHAQGQMADVDQLRRLATRISAALG